VKTYFVYLMTNRSRTVLYAGVTNDLPRRVWEHQNGFCKGFTKKYKLDRLVHYEPFNDVSDAIAREKQIKGWTRTKKNALVASVNPKCVDLGGEITHQLRGPSPSGAAQDDICSGVNHDDNAPSATATR
jgi:putative endonuclease